MKRASLAAGILLYRRAAAGIEVLLVHPGGPLWANKDAGAWTLPKGVPEPGEELLACALRELREETGVTAAGPFHDLGEVRQKGGKVVHAWAAAGDGDPAAMTSDTFAMEWPPRSGRMSTFPEVDRWSWFDLGEARGRVNPAQAELLERLAARLG